MMSSTVAAAAAEVGADGINEHQHYCRRCNASVLCDAPDCELDHEVEICVVCDGGSQ